jgi:hypothetical protein
LGGILLGAGVIGAVAGLSVKDSANSAQAETTKSHTHPFAGRGGELGASSPGSIAVAPEQQLSPPARAVPPQLRQRREVSRQRPGWSDKMAESLSAESAAANNVAGDTEPQSVDPLQVPKAVAADLPLSNRVVARTIDRIGYRCGEVSATAPVEGEGQGIYKITCSSGHTYQATPSHGRYRFRRLDSH